MFASPPYMDGSMVFASLRQCAPHLTHASLGPPKSIPQSASRSVQPFLHSSRQKIPILYNGPPFPLMPLRMGKCSRVIYASLGQTHSVSQTAFRSVEPFLHSSRQSVHVYCIVVASFPVKIASSHAMEDLYPM